MSINRARKQAAGRLGLEFRKRYAALIDARGEDEIQTRAIELGALFNDNVEYVIWALMEVGGLDPQPPEPIRRHVALPQPAFLQD